MLSICIPIYNHDVRALVGALGQQMKPYAGEVEMVCIDDGSSPSYKALNREIAGACNYVEFPSNVGRSKVRNLFLRHVGSDCRYMLFMDCDMSVTRSDFLLQYLLEARRGQAMVVVGGHVYPATCPGPDYRLHYLNGTKRASRPVQHRSKHPNRSFMTGNFMIRKDLLAQIPFEERIVGYGHEDTLMGFRLQKAGVSILHADNPLLADQLDTNSEFLDKTRVSVANLAKIVRWVDDADFDRQVTLVRYARMVERLRLKAPARWVLGGLAPWLERRLLDGKGGILALLLYKESLYLNELD